MSTEMVKDGETQTFPDNQVDDALAAGWQPVDGYITRYVAYTDPGTGERRLRRGRVRVENYGAVSERLNEQGAALVSPTPVFDEAYSQQERTRREVELSEREGPLSQFAFSAIDRLAFGGLSSQTRYFDPAAGAELQRAREILERERPGVETAAQLASIGVPLLMGGAGFLRAFAGPTGLAMEAGQLARAGLGNSLVGRITAGALEGGLDVAITEAVEANIRNDYEGLSERMLSSGAVGALFGGAVEGGLFARQAIAQRRAARQALGPTSFDQLTAQPPGILRRIWNSATEIASGQNPNQFRVSRMGNIPVVDDAATAAAREVYANPGGFVAPLADDVSDGLAAYRRAANDLRDARWIQTQQARDAWAAAPNRTATIDQLGNAAARARQAVDANRIRGELGTLSANVEDAVQRARRADVVSIDDLDQPLLTPAQRAQQQADAIQDILAARERIKGLEGKTGLTGNIAAELRAGIDDALEQAGGDFAGLFKKRQDFLNAVDQMEVIAGKVANSPNGVPRINANHLKTLLDDFARGGNVQTVSTLESLVNPDLLNDAIGTFGLKMPGVNPEAAQRVARGIDKWEAYQQFRNLELNVNSASGFGAALGFGGVGYALSGDDPAEKAAGVAAGFGLAALAKPTGAARFMNTIRNFFRGQDSRIQSSVVNVTDAMRGTSLPSSRIAPVTAAGRAFLSQDREERSRTYEQMASRVEEMLANPNSFYTAMLPEVEGADQVNPQLGTQMGMDAQRALHVLAENIPLSRRNRNALPQIPNIQIPATDSEMDEFLEAAAVIEDPVLSLDLYAAGRLSNTGARALERAYPGFYRGMTSAVFQEYSRMTQGGEMPDFQATIRASTLFGFNLDPSMEAGMVYSFQSNYSQTSEQERAVRSPDTVRREVNNLYASNNQTMSQGLQQ